MPSQKDSYEYRTLFNKKTKGDELEHITSLTHLVERRVEDLGHQEQTYAALVHSGLGNDPCMFVRGQQENVVQRMVLCDDRHPESYPCFHQRAQPLMKQKKKCKQVIVNTNMKYQLLFGTLEDGQRCVQGEWPEE